MKNFTSAPAAKSLICFFILSFVFATSFANNHTTTDTGAVNDQISSFAGAYSNNTVSLRWVAGQKISASHFEIERSFDGITFSVVGIALDGFENGDMKNYAFKEKAADLKGKSAVYYRLKEISADGKTSSYSNKLAVDLTGGN